MPLLDQDTISRLHQAAVSLGLQDLRAALLAQLSADFIALLPTSEVPAAQLLMDLDNLNKAARLVNGDVPMIIWLRNAVILAAGRSEVSIFQNALLCCKRRVPVHDSAASEGILRTAPPHGRGSHGEPVSERPVTVAPRSASGPIVATTVHYLKLYPLSLLLLLTAPSQFRKRFMPTRQGDQRVYVDNMLVLALNVLLGSAMYRRFPGAYIENSIFTSAPIIVFLWLAYGLAVHGLCRLCGGKASGLVTIYATITVLSVTFLLSNFAALLWTAVMERDPRFAIYKARMYHFSDIHSLLRAPVEAPFLVYFFLQFFLLSAYLPSTVSPLNELSPKRALVVRIAITLIGVPFIVMLSNSLFGCFGFPAGY